MGTKNKGLFITLEGGDGSGKTSVKRKLEDYFQMHNLKFISTREPGGVSIAEQVREIILHLDNRNMDARTEALLFASVRRQHLVEKIIPALERGEMVLCDRFIDSSLAYQGYARNVGVEEVLKINQFAVDGCMPDITFLLDIDPEVALYRIQQNSRREVNRLDLEALDFYHKVRDGYQICKRLFSNRIQVIDANRSLDEVFAQILVKLHPKL